MALKILTATLFTILSIGVFAQNPDAIVGRFKNEERNEIIEIYKAKDGFYYGKTPAGQIILSRLMYNPSNKSYTGTMTPPGKDFTMSATIIIESNDKLKMVVEKLMISRTNYLTRIK